MADIDRCQFCGDVLTKTFSSIVGWVYYCSGNCVLHGIDLTQPVWNYLSRLAEQNEKMKAALEFYAPFEKYKELLGLASLVRLPDLYKLELLKDAGTKAREALEAVNEHS